MTESENIRSLCPRLGIRLYEADQDKIEQITTTLNLRLASPFLKYIPIISQLKVHWHHFILVSLRPRVLKVAWLGPTTAQFSEISFEPSFHWTVY